MSRTVDLVIAGGGARAVAAASEALHRGRQVLILLRSCDWRAGRRVRRRLRAAMLAGAGQVKVETCLEVVCVDGVDGVEVVVVRHVRTRRVSAVNASACLWRHDDDHGDAPAVGASAGRPADRRASRTFKDP